MRSLMKTNYFPCRLMTASIRPNSVIYPPLLFAREQLEQWHITTDCSRLPASPPRSCSKWTMVMRRGSGLCSDWYVSIWACLAMGPLVEPTRKPLCAICRQIVLQAMNFTRLLFTLFSPLGNTRRHTQHRKFRALRPSVHILNCVRKDEVVRTLLAFWSHWLILVYHDCTLILYLYILWEPSVLRILIRCQFHDSHIFHVRGMLDDIIQNDCWDVSVQSSWRA